MPVKGLNSEVKSDETDSVWSEEPTDDLGEAVTTSQRAQALDDLVTIHPKLLLPALQRMFGNPRKSKSGRGKTHEHVWTLRLNSGPVLIASAASLIAFYVNNDPTGTANGAAVYDWTSFASIFSEYRVKKVKATVHPIYNAVSTTTDVGVVKHLASCIDDEAATAATAPTVASVWGREDTFVFHNQYKPVFHEWNVQYQASNPDDTWTLTSAPAPTGAIKFAGASLTAAADLYYIRSSLEVEFRGFEA